MLAVADDCVQPWPKILVVDDHRESLDLAHAMLEAEGYTVFGATEGAAALDAFEQHRPDCVLLEVRMPDLDGVSVCRGIRALPGGHDTSILVLTAQRDLETFDSALLAGCDDFLTKPIRADELLAHVRTALKLRHMSAQLRERCSLLRAQRDELVRLQLQKDRLTSFVIHDLKSPVTAMDMHAQLLLRNPELPETARDSLLRIQEQAHAMSRLVMDLLDISKSEEGRLVARAERIDLAPLVGTLLEASAPRAQRAGVTLASDLEVTELSADPDLLRRVLENLLDNALRHAPSGSSVRISTRWHARGGIELRVADEGPGIARELRQRVFERFAQLEQGDRTLPRSGCGLGLAFCKLAVAAQGGSIRIEDTAPGATFCIHLPRTGNGAAARS